MQLSQICPTNAIFKILTFYLLSTVLCFEDQDDLYRNQFQKRAVKNRGSGQFGLGDVVFVVVSSSAGFFIGQYYTSRQKSQMKKKHAAEIQKVWKNSVFEREQMIKHKNGEIQQIKKQLKEGYKQIEELEEDAYKYGIDVGMGTLKADYEEFKMPDTDNDDKISREEFNTYVKAYMKAYPDIPLSEYPKFEEFDTNKDGIVTFEEWQQFLFRQRLEEQKGAQVMYDQSGSAGNFQNMYDQLLKKAKH